MSRSSHKRDASEEYMATAAAGKDKIKDFTFNWEGKDKAGKVVKGELRAQGEAMVNATLRRQGILVTKVKKQKAGGGGRVTEKDITLFTRQLATIDRKSTRLNSSHANISYAVFCL